MMSGERVLANVGHHILLPIPDPSLKLRMRLEGASVLMTANGTSMHSSTDFPVDRLRLANDLNSSAHR